MEKKFYSESFHRETDRRLLFKFCEMLGEIVRHLPDQKTNKISAASQTVASARIAPKIY